MYVHDVVILLTRSSSVHMERDQLQAAEQKVRAHLASPESDGWKEPVGEKEEKEKPQLGGPSAPKLECRVVEKVIGQNKEKVDLRLARASIDIAKPPKAVFDLIWDINGYKVRPDRCRLFLLLRTMP